MYSDGTDGHEADGVQVVTPGWWTSATLDYRPTHPGRGQRGRGRWPGWIGRAGYFEDWKGALDPTGDGSEVGPRECLAPQDLSGPGDGASVPGAFLH